MECDVLVSSSKSIDVGVEQLFPKHGFSLKLNQVDNQLMIQLQMIKMDLYQGKLSLMIHMING